MKRAKALLAFLLVSASVFLSVPVREAFAAGPTLLQSNSNSCTPNASPFSCTVAFSSSVAASDLLTVGVGAASTSSASVTFAFSDTVGSTWTVVATNCITDAAGRNYCTVEGYAKAKSAGSDTVTVQETGDTSASTPFYELTAHEWSGVTTPFVDAHAFGSCTSASCSTSASTSSISFQSANPYVADAVFAWDASAALQSCLPGTSYTSYFLGGSTNKETCNQYSSTSGSPTTAPATIGPFATNGGWTESAVVVYYATVTVPVTCNMANSAPAQTPTFSGGNVSPTSAACDGVSRSFVMAASQVLTATEPSSPATGVQLLFSNGLATTTDTACSAAGSTCPGWTITNYYQFSLNGLNSLFTSSRISLGVNGSVSSNDWYDYGTKFKVTGAVLSPNTIVTYPSTINMPVYINQPCIDGSQVLTNVSTTGAGCGQSGVQGQSEAVFSAAKVKVVYFFPPGANVVAIYDGGVQLVPSITTVPQGSLYIVTGSSLWIVNYVLAPKGAIGFGSSPAATQGPSSSTTGFQYATYAGVLGGGAFLGYAYYERTKKTPKDWLKGDVGGKTLGTLSPETGSRRHGDLSPKVGSKRQGALERGIEGSKAYGELSATLGSGALGGLAMKPNKASPLKELKG